MTRTLKAYRCKVEGYDEHAIAYGMTASKARVKLWREMRDFNDSITLTDISIRRWTERDIHFPPMPAVAVELDEHDREIIIHTYGGGTDVSPKQWGYRDHYCAAQDDPRLNRLAGLGVFDGPNSGEKRGTAI